ncbi:hypothetical protein JXJ21_19980 [candidate division KSB1 bacterium]|nr:hypothetical protein [candidate division KSB1 bacterium]
MDKKIFLELSSAEVVRIITQRNKPGVVIFVPDGTRKMTRILSNLSPPDDEFYFEYARLTTEMFLNNLRVFFDHGLETLLVPLVSTHVLRRNEQFRQITLQQGFKALFGSNAWLDFYDENQIQVNVYGDLQLLEESGFSDCLKWIEAARHRTAKHTRHQLFYGLAAPENCGMALSTLAIQFYKETGREPAHADLVRIFYGKALPQANIFIMSTKLAGLGALPPFICDRNTQVYYLAAPGVLALTRDTYRQILYDYLFGRCQPDVTNAINEKYGAIEQLKQFYAEHQFSIVGLGKKIGKFWVPEI